MNANFSATGNINASQSGVSLSNTMRRTNIRSNFPKLVGSKRTIVEEEMSKTINPSKVAER
jgi:hypothetical protein